MRVARLLKRSPRPRPCARRAAPYSPAPGPLHSPTTCAHADEWRGVIKDYAVTKKQALMHQNTAGDHAHGHR